MRSVDKEREEGEIEGGGGDEVVKLEEEKVSSTCRGGGGGGQEGAGRQDGEVGGRVK